MRFVFAGGRVGGLPLWLRSDSGCFVMAAALACFLNRENTGRRFWTGEGELVGKGEDGGLDRGASSDQSAGEFLGLDVGGSEASRGAVESFMRASSGFVLAVSTSVVCMAHSTRLRLVGGSSSYSWRFFRAYVLTTFLKYCQFEFS
jgi:hypothetical protein